jgi:streptogramin lyase
MSANGQHAQLRQWDQTNRIVDSRGSRRCSRVQRRPRLETLEPRCLMTASPTITEFPIHTPNADPLFITAGSDGDLWFTENGVNQIGRITPAGVATDFPLPPNTYPYDITEGPDGNIWFTSLGVIGRMTPTGKVTEFGIGSTNSPLNITTGADGNLWFTLPIGNHFGQIGKITPTSTTTSYLTVVPADADVVVPNEPSYGPGSTIPANTVLPAGTFTVFTLSTTAYDGPQGIAAGPDGNLWFTEFSGNRIGRITPSGAITEFPIPTGTSTPLEITAGDDGNLWFTEGEGNNIGRITPSGAITEFPVPSAISEPLGITAGADGNLWFTEESGNNIGRITPEGDVTEFSVPTLNSFATGIAAGSDGDLWFTEYAANQIGRLQLPPLMATGTTISATEGAPFSGVVASFTDPDIQGTPTDFQATINWGDGTRTAGQISEDASQTFYVTGSHTYAEYGSGLKISISIADDYGRDATAESTANVLSNTPLVPLSVSALPTLPKGTLLSGVVVASFTDRNPATTASFWATIDWGDGSPQSIGIITEPGVNSPFAVEGNHTYLREQAAPYVITVTVHDQEGITVVTTTTATVTNRPPLVTGIPVKMTKGLPFAAPVAYIVENLGLPAEPAGNYAASINWGDGTQVTAGMVAAIPGGDWVVGSHVYAKSGPYTISVTVKEGGFSVVATAEAFDPPAVPGGPRRHLRRPASHQRHKTHPSAAIGSAGGSSGKWKDADLRLPKTDRAQMSV